MPGRVPKTTRHSFGQSRLNVFRPAKRVLLITLDEIVAVIWLVPAQDSHWGKSKRSDFMTTTGGYIMRYVLAFLAFLVPAGAVADPAPQRCAKHFFNGKMPAVSQNLLGLSVQ